MENLLADGGYKTIGLIVFAASAIIATSGLATLSREIVSSWMRRKNKEEDVVTKSACKKAREEMAADVADIEMSLNGLEKSVELYHRELKDNELKSMKEMLQTLVGRS